MGKVDNIGLKVLLLWLAVTLTGCNREAKVLLERAEAYLPMQQDSAEMCLNSIEEPERLDDALRAWYGLLRTYTDNRQDKGVKSDSLIRNSYEYYRDASHAGQTADKTLMRRYAQSCYYMALYYSSCDSTKQCEDMLHQAIKYSEKCEDWHTCYLAYTQLGGSTIFGNPEYAIQQALKALDIYHKINDDVNNEVLILGHIAACYFTFAEPDSALMYFNMGERLAVRNHLTKSQNSMYMGMADVYRYMGDYEKALDYAKKGFTTAEGEVRLFSLLSLAECYQACDSLEKAKEILDTIRYNANPTNKYFVYRALSQIAIRQHNYDSIYVYADSAYECLEDRYLLSQRVKDEYYQANLAKELEKEKIQHEAEMSRWIGGAVILFVLLIASFIIYTVLRHKKRMEADHQKEMLHQQEIIRQKSFALAVLRQHLLEKLEHSCQLLSNGEEAQMTDEAWKEMERLLNDTDSHFVERLRKQRKDFKEEDIQLCMLVRMKMPNTIISKIYHIGVDAVKKRKLSLKKNGFKVTDPTIPLEDVVDQL